MGDGGTAPSETQPRKLMLCFLVNKKLKPLKNKQFYCSPGMSKKKSSRNPLKPSFQYVLTNHTPLIVLN